MVRRWSRIITSNRHPITEFTRVANAAFDANVNSSMYLRRVYTSETSLRRRQWARRRHFSNWLPLSNVLKDWAVSYRFYRNYARFAINQHFSNSSLIAFNLVASLNTSPALVRGAENVVVGRVSRRWVTYFSRFNASKWRVFQVLKSSLPIFVSFDSRLVDRAGLLESRSFAPLLEVQNSVILNYSPTGTPTTAAVGVIRGLMSIPFSALKQSLASVYRLLIMLSLLNTLR